MGGGYLAWGGGLLEEEGEGRGGGGGGERKREPLRNEQKQRCA